MRERGKRWKNNRPDANVAHHRIVCCCCEAETFFLTLSSHRSILIATQGSVSTTLTLCSTALTYRVSRTTGLTAADRTYLSWPDYPVQLAEKKIAAATDDAYLLCCSMAKKR